jgi:hypothetical protein
MIPYFHFISGGYLGSATEVRWKNDVLTICKGLVVVEEYADCKNYHLAASDERLQRVFDYLSKRIWKKEYKDPYVCDGYYWSLRFATDSFELVTEGSNKQPRGFVGFLKLLDVITREYGVKVY